MWLCPRSTSIKLVRYQHCLSLFTLLTFQEINSFGWYNDTVDSHGRWVLTCYIPSDWLCADFWYKLVWSWTQLRFYVRVAWPLTFFQFLLQFSCCSVEILSIIVCVSECISTLLSTVDTCCRNEAWCVGVMRRYVRFTQVFAGAPQFWCA